LFGFSLLTTSTSAFACEHENHSWTWFGWCNHSDKDKDKGRDCDHDRDRDRDCNHGGSSSSGGSSSGSTGHSTRGGSTSGGGAVEAVPRDSRNTHRPPETRKNQDRHFKKKHARQSQTNDLFGASSRVRSITKVSIRTVTWNAEPVSLTST
jgi:hypothetical protein